MVVSQLLTAYAKRTTQTDAGLHPAWIVATILLVSFGFQLVRMAMGHTTSIMRWLQVGAMTLVGLILLALGSIFDRLSQIVLCLQNHNTITRDRTQ
jgi:protein-S-isoprenylcysteine O-methyltransferase Ste14